MTSLAAQTELGVGRKEGLRVERLVLPGWVMLGRGKGWLLPPQLNGLEGRGQWGRGQQRCPFWGLGQCHPFSLHLPTSSMGLDLGAPCGVRSGGQPGSWSLSPGLMSLLVDGVLSSRALLHC